MAGTTTNNGWDYPSSSDLVTDGALNIQTLATDIDTSVGTGLLAWTSYTPVLTASTTNPTIGNSVWDAAYCKIGKTVHVRIKLTLGSTFSAGSGAYIFSLPVTPKTGSEGTPTGMYVDSSASNVYRVVGRAVGSVINRSYTTDGGAGFLSSTAPVVPANTDIYIYSYTYEAA